MKKISWFLATLAVLPSVSMAAALDATTVRNVEEAVVAKALLGVNPANMIDWKIGDTNTLSVSIGPMPNIGSMVQTVASEEGNAIWVHQDLDLKVQKQKIQMLLSRADGTVLKLLVNGQEQSVPNNPLEIIEQSYTKITVPAGTFDVLYIKAKSDGKIIEAWANPVEIPMDGIAKQVAELGMGNMMLTMELQKAVRGR